MKGGAHQRLVDNLDDRVAHHYTKTWKNLEYRSEGRKNITGEYDVLGYRVDNHGNRWWTYYEVKSRDSGQAWEKAQVQFAHARATFPDRNWHFVYHTPEVTMHETRFGSSYSTTQTFK